MLLVISDQKASLCNHPINTGIDLLGESVESLAVSFVMQNVVVFSEARQHNVQHLLQNVCLQLGAGNPLPESYQGKALQMHRVRPWLLDKGE